MGRVVLRWLRLVRAMNPRSRMGVTIRPEIHAHLTRLGARFLSASPVPEPSMPTRVPPRPQAKLSPERVRTLRRLHAEGVTLAALAGRFHVAVSTAWRAVRGVTWRS